MMDTVLEINYLDKPVDANHNEEPKKESANQPLRSLTRLLLGGLLVGSDELVNRMNHWEKSIPEESVEEERPAERETLSDEIESLPDDLPPPTQGQSQILSQEPQIDDLAIGLLFSAQERISNNFDRISRLNARITHLTSPLTKNLPNYGSYTPLKSTIDKLVERGESEVNQWSTIGKQEKARSKQIFNTASQSTIDGSIDYLTQNEELKELVQQQSTGLAEEIIEEVRERAFSMDTLLESAVRSVFRMKPRSEIPPPTVEVREHAERLRKKKRV